MVKKIRNWREFPSSDPSICHGELCAKGTHVFVTNILDSLAEGATRDEILKSYPSLKPEHIESLWLMLPSWPMRESASIAWQMRFKLDENLPGEIASYLQQKGHETETVSDDGLGWPLLCVGLGRGALHFPGVAATGR